LCGEELCQKGKYDDCGQGRRGVEDKLNQWLAMGEGLFCGGGGGGGGAGGVESGGVDVKYKRKKKVW
jgi:hypothetical protein